MFAFVDPILPELRPGDGLAGKNNLWESGVWL